MDFNLMTPLELQLHGPNILFQLNPYSSAIGVVIHIKAIFSYFTDYSCVDQAPSAIEQY
jgi:hypothetical protein